MADRSSKEDEAEDLELIRATRLLAHMIVPEDLVPWAEHLLPTDYLPPEERAASWRKRINE